MLLVDCPRWGSSTAQRLGSIFKSALTGPDNQSWAPGRIMGFIVFTLAQALVVRAALDILRGHPSVADWCSFLSGVSAFEAAICATATGLVLGMAPTDPGGRWWGKEASPPPPPTA